MLTGWFSLVTFVFRCLLFKCHIFFPSVYMRLYKILVCIHFQQTSLVCLLYGFWTHIGSWLTKILIWNFHLGISLSLPTLQDVASSISDLLSIPRCNHSTFGNCDLSWSSLTNSLPRCTTLLFSPSLLSCWLSF